MVQRKTSTAAVYLFAAAAISAWLLPRYQPSKPLPISLGPVTFMIFLSVYTDSSAALTNLGEG